MRFRTQGVPVTPLVVAVLLAIAGVTAMRLSHAATTSASAESEAGVIAGPAELKRSGDASGASQAASVAFGTGNVGSSGLYQSACSKNIITNKLGNFKSTVFDEVSGIAASRTTDDTYWVHNDSGDSARIFSVNDSGALLGTFNLSAVSAIDWEDIALGPGPITGQSYIYIADTGNNDLDRNPVQIYRFPEPNPGSGNSINLIGGADKLNVTYPDAAKHNVEAMFVDPATSELYLIDKSDSRPAEIFKSPPKLVAGSTTMLTKVGSLGYRSGSKYELITAADISASGDTIAVRTYEHAYLYQRLPSMSVSDSLQSAACALPSFVEPQVEAIGFKRSGKGLVTTSEGLNQLLYNFESK